MIENLKNFAEIMGWLIADIGLVALAIFAACAVFGLIVIAWKTCRGEI